MTSALREDLTTLPAHRLGEMIAAGELSSSQLTADCLARIGAANGKLHAFVEVYEEEARAAAEARDREVQDGKLRGPLHGVPVAVKDLCDIKGRVTTCGSLLWKDRISPVTATIVERLEAAGMVVLGKTHMVEFAFGTWGTNAAMGMPWNPWDLKVHRVPGGSSSGTGVAVAAGMAPTGIGSDTGGSVRIPSSMCGLVGLKTTVGRISNHGILPLSETLDTIGPMAHSVRDAALMFAIMEGPDPKDQATFHKPPVDPLAELESGIQGLHLGILNDAGREGLNGEVLAAYDAACRMLEQLGATLGEVHLPDSLPAFLEQTGRIIGAEAYAVHKDWIDDQTVGFDPGVQTRIIKAGEITAAEYIRALSQRRVMQRETSAILDHYAAFLTPTTPIVAAPFSQVDEDIVPLGRFTRIINYLDRCGLALPCGLSAEGLPISLQIVGRGYDEAGVLRIGRAFEKAFGWDKRPDISELLG